MFVRRTIAICAVVAMLTVGTLTPSRAHASTSDDFIYAGIATAGWIGLVVLGTWYVNRTPNEAPPGQLMLTPADVDVRRDQSEPTVRFAQHCRQTGPAPTLICW
jgi:hypothetical protein